MSDNEQKSLFPTEEDETKAKPEFKPASVEEKRKVLDHMIEEGICYKCGNALPAANTVLWEGMPYHKGCLPFIRKDDLESNPRLSLTLSLRASELALLAELVSEDTSLKVLYDKLADTLCEHGHSYVRCVECGLLVSRNGAIISTGYTRDFMVSSGAVISVSSGRFFSRIRGIEAFCSKACDLNYSKSAKTAWDKEQAEKAAKKSSTSGEDKKPSGLKLLMQIAKTRPDVAAKLQEVMEMLKSK